MFFLYVLGEDFTAPPGELVWNPKVRLMDEFTAGTHEGIIKDILMNFASPTAPLQIVIHVATIALGMGVDCSDIFQIIYIEPPEDPKSYIQQVVCSGRDMKPS